MALLVANEIIWSRLWSTYVLVGVYFPAVFCYFTFFVPTVLSTMGLGVFLTSGFVSAGLVIGLVLYLDAHNVFGAPGPSPAPSASCWGSWAWSSCSTCSTGSRPWDTDDAPFHLAPGDTVHCFAAVFAPTDLRTTVYHHWQYYDAERKAWVDTDRLGYRVVGGRRSGYRGYTFKQHVHPGAWRVTVETPGGRPIGRIRFDVVPADSPRNPDYATRYYR